MLDPIASMKNYSPARKFEKGCRVYAIYIYTHTALRGPQCSLYRFFLNSQRTPTQCQWPRTPSASSFGSFGSYFDLALGSSNFTIRLPRVKILVNTLMRARRKLIKIRIHMIYWRLLVYCTIKKHCRKVISRKVIRAITALPVHSSFDQLLLTPFREYILRVSRA